MSELLTAVKRSASIQKSDTGAPLLVDGSK